MFINSSDFKSSFDPVLKCKLCLMDFDTSDNVATYLYCHHHFCANCVKKISTLINIVNCPICSHLNKPNCGRLPVHNLLVSEKMIRKNLEIAEREVVKSRIQLDKAIETRQLLRQCDTNFKEPIIKSKEKIKRNDVNCSTNPLPDLLRKMSAEGTQKSINLQRTISIMKDKLEKAKKY